MKKKIQIIFVILLWSPFIYIFIAEFFTPIGNYIEKSEEIKISNIEIIEDGYKNGFGYMLYFTIIYSETINKYFVILFIAQNRSIGVHPKIPLDTKELTVVVNADFLNNPKYGTRENPIPVMNYKLEGKDEYEFDQKQYEYNIKKYKAYGWSIKF